MLTLADYFDYVDRTLSLCSCGEWLQQLPVVCEKCYFLLAEERKKQKMFSHTPWGLFRERVCGFQAHFVVAFAIA